MYVYTNLRPEDVLPTKKDVSVLNMYATDVAGQGSEIMFGWKPSPPEKTPFRDERVRQAYSMAIDRDAWINAFYNVSRYEAEGLPMEARWSTALSPDFDGWWLNPRGKEFGPNAKYFEHNVAEAKKLLAAAGYPNGLEVLSTWPPTGSPFVKRPNVSWGEPVESLLLLPRVYHPAGAIGG